MSESESTSASTSTSGSRGWRTWVEPWYGGYGLVGLVLLGVGPILIPLQVDPKGAAAVGLVVAAFYVGALFTPLVGAYADRTGRQKSIFLVCFPLMSLTMIGFAYAGNVWLWAVLAAIFGGAGAVAGTIGGMFVVEGHPEAEWNERISWFRLAYGLGQVVGLLIAAFTATRLLTGWWIAAVAIACGLIVGRIGIPHLRTTSHPAAHLAPQSSARPIGAISWALHAFHRPTIASLRSAVSGPYGLFLLVWLLTMIGVQTFFNVVPLIMRDTFGVKPSLTSILFMVGAVIGAAMYPTCGKLADRFGPGRVMALGMLITICSFGAMALASWREPSFKSVVGDVALVTAALAYSFEVVGATMLTARLTPVSEGSAMGLLNSAIAAGAIVGAIVPSWVAASFGYKSLPLMATGVLLVALALGSPILLRKPRETAA